MWRPARAVIFVSVLCNPSHLLQTNPNASLSLVLSTHPRIKHNTSSVKTSFMHNGDPRFKDIDIDAEETLTPGFRANCKWELLLA
ncbi:hypothetical protein GYH30_029442 [Glycine max]|nr:hypothetical protein GYH30_029442 [Glycine max]